MRSTYSVKVPLLLFLVASSCLGHQSSTGTAASDDGDRAQRSTLNAFVRTFGTRRLNHVLVTTVENDLGECYVYGFWKEDKSILLLDHFRGSVSMDSLRWLHRKARISLEHDLVESADSVGTSTYLVSREWADHIVGACLKSGREIIVDRRAR